MVRVPSLPPTRRSRRSRLRPVGAAVGLSVAMVGGVLSAAPAGANGVDTSPAPPEFGWTSSATVAAPAATTSDARVGVDSTGTPTVVWSHGGQVWTSTRVAGSWSAAGLLGTGVAPRLGVAPSGAAVVVWVTVTAGTAVVNGARRGTDGAWAPLAPLPVTGTIDPQPALDVASDGTAVVALRCDTGAGLQVWSAALGAGASAWGTQTAVSAATGVASPSVGLGADGAGLLAWVEPGGGATVVRAATRGVDGAFASPAELAPVTATPVTGVAVDVAPDGTAAAAWSTALGGHSVIRSAVRGGSGLWSEPATISWADQESSFPDVAVASGGIATATWLTTSYGKVMTATSGPGGGRWSDVYKLAYYGGSPSGPDAAVAPDGTPFAAWAVNPGGVARNETPSASGVETASRSLPVPVNLTPPRMSSPVLVDYPVTCLSGTWDKVGPQTWWAYWWLRDGAFIDGANDRVYRPTAADLGHRLQCKQKAGNGDVYAYVFSAAVVVGAGVAPRNLRKPASVGTPRVGSLLTCRVGTWSMRVTSVRVQWLRSGRVIRGATVLRYRLTGADRGRYASCRVTVVRSAHRPGVAVSPALRVR